VAKTADAAAVDAGSAIGFTVTVTNTGTGTARNATLDDPLPAATGVDWSISPAYAGPGTCTITGEPATETLTCAFGSLAPGAGATVHVASATGPTTSVSLANTATARADNATAVQASATITVSPVAVQDVVIERPVAVAPATLPRTGTDTGREVRVALFLLALGGLALVPEHLRPPRFRQDGRSVAGRVVDHDQLKG